MRKCKSDRLVAEKTFEALKPSFVHTVQETPLRGARCEYCANFGKTREALIGLGMKCIPRNHAEAVEATWCAFRKNKRDVITSRKQKDQKVLLHDLPRKECVLRECVTCGVTEYERKLLAQNRLVMRQGKEVHWKQWGAVKAVDKNGNPTTRTELLSKSGSVVNLLKLYINQVDNMSTHQFFKLWQLRNFNMILENFQFGQIIFVHDFQQNLLLIPQDAVSSSHWDNPQLTIHPTCVFYRCPACAQLVKEDIIHISKDKNHDKNAVNQFISTTIQHLRNKNISISEIIEFTDHASSQYKSKFTFNNMTKLDIPCTWHFFGVKHGKGPSDRAGANFKRAIRSAVKAGHELLTANAIENYCKEHFDRQILCDGQRDGQHDGQCDGQRDGKCTKRDVVHSLLKVYNHKKIRRPKQDPKVRTLEGSRDFLHVVRNTGIRGLVEYRNFDCGCVGCTLHTGECTQKEYADDWKSFRLLPGKKYASKEHSSEWFKPLSIQNYNNNNDLMEFEEEVDVMSVNCDEIEEEDELDVQNGYEVESDVKTTQEREREAEIETTQEDERDVTFEAEHETSERERDVTLKEALQQGDVRDVTFEAERETSEHECDVTLKEALQERGVQDSDSDASVQFLFTEEYVSSDDDNESGDDNDPIYAEDIPHALSEDDENVRFNWRGVLADMKEYTTFNGLKRYVQRTRLPEVLPIVKYMVDEHDVIDTIADYYYPRKDGPRNYLLIETIGDGNCGYRALAHVLLSDENRHHEVRVRITFEAVMKEISFLQHDILTRGSSRGSQNRPASYATYSGHITPEITILNQHSICTVYHREVLANSKEFTYMGVWQIHHAAEAFKRPIGCVYPRRTNRDLRSDLNRIVLPINPSHDQKRPVYIMWTPLSINDGPIVVKHFVALLVKFSF